ncbi:DUF4330 domain-containing protein [Cyanobacterium sp. Dongsha4]|uniref:DUF4330 domain-containing protein n=1 Tax=Cyanobacterium sp. DS4 TaxID=2878255 RepID=UPI002E806D8C|nr:DUF4330 domain-containing protein [Cyanobacterium sp. Dongsha4]WVK99307.1 DUF4330 domain-containing protein [Cyanobacterium sp. Dongsha4]
MKIIDSKGRLFGKINILDLGAIAVIVLVLIGIFIVPGPKGSIAQVGSGGDTIELNLLVRGLSVKNPQEFLGSLENSSVKIIVRNEPAGSLNIESVEELPNYVVATQPDGSVKSLPDPRPIVALSTDMILYMNGKGSMTNDGAILANQKVKIGTVLELDGSNYNFRGSVIDVRKKQ